MTAINFLGGHPSISLVIITENLFIAEYIRHTSIGGGILDFLQGIAYLATIIVAIITIVGAYNKHKK